MSHVAQEPCLYAWHVMCVWHKEQQQVDSDDVLFKSRVVLVQDCSAAMMLQRLDPAGRIFKWSLHLSDCFRISDPSDPTQATRTTTRRSMPLGSGSIPQQLVVTAGGDAAEVAGSGGGYREQGGGGHSSGIAAGHSRESLRPHAAMLLPRGVRSKVGLYRQNPGNHLRAESAGDGVHASASAHGSSGDARDSGKHKVKTESVETAAVRSAEHVHISSLASLGNFHDKDSDLILRQDDGSGGSEEAAPEPTPDLGPCRTVCPMHSFCNETIKACRYLHSERKRI